MSINDFRFFVDMLVNIDRLIRIDIVSEICIYYSIEMHAKQRISSNLNGTKICLSNQRVDKLTISLADYFVDH